MAMTRTHGSRNPLLECLRWLSLLAFVAPAAGAATLNVVGGELVGASDVNVGGTLYDVVFVDDTCINLYSGCDEVLDFTFTNSVDATAASQALIDQVFLDGGAGNFDTDPNATVGCAPKPPSSTTTNAGPSLRTASA